MRAHVTHRLVVEAKQLLWLDGNPPEVAAVGDLGLGRMFGETNGFPASLPRERSASDQVGSSDGEAVLVSEAQPRQSTGEAVKLAYRSLVEPSDVFRVIVAVF